MVLKLIKVFVKPGQMSQFLQAQEIWNRRTATDPGYLSHFCGYDPREPDVVYLLFCWRTRQDLDRWMAHEHDAIAAEAGSNAFYERTEVRILEAVSGIVHPPDEPEHA